MTCYDTQHASDHVAIKSLINTFTSNVNTKFDTNAHWSMDMTLPI